MSHLLRAVLLPILPTALLVSGCTSGSAGSRDDRVIGSNEASPETSSQGPASSSQKPHDLVIESGFTSGKDSIGVLYTSAGARVSNPNEQLAAYDVQVLFNLLDSKGRVVDTTTEDVPYIAPRASVPVSPLQIGFDLKSEPAKLEVQAIGDFAEDHGPKGLLSDKAAILKVQGAHVVRNDFGSELSARVTNTTDAVTEYPSWACIFVTGNRIIGGASSTIVDPIPPGSTVQFGDLLTLDEIRPAAIECQVLADLS